ncbi:DNA ligase D [Bdellovibrio bacteriovorus]|uniref:DNA ligase D n=1 Tax=Bdellovibrio bacteriovorus TaxID=959 RepID=UPI0021CFE2CA|nr:DNA ligase D [Bdellovibrio bacteriovorus]UXR63322.1 DNA ligase D [Bdellovibrio bacteriovorus]
MSLRTYGHKRDFKKTPEPSAKKRRKKSMSSMMFVVQEHHASHLHYDFRLEWEGVLKSWAVPKGPSLDPHLKRLAVQVEDHPLDYGRFEGTIPKDQYGAGEVYIWDTGIWIPKSSPAAGLKKGHLEFELKGHRLKGAWDLIRTKFAGKSPQWLLVKRDDTYAKPGYEAPMEKVNFVKPMLALLVNKPPQGKEWLHETKWDGYRIQAHLAGNSPKLYTRAGHDWAGKMPSLAKELSRIHVQSAVLDGEVVVLDKKGRSHFQSLQNYFEFDPAQKLTYMVFDLLMLNGEDLRGLPLKERRSRLKKILKGRRGHIRLSQELKSVDAGSWGKLQKQGVEGVVSKKIESGYVSGRKGEWVKSKFLNRQEFVIGGYALGKGSRSEFGALLLGVYEKNKLRFVGKVGTGFDQKKIKSLLLQLKKIHTKENPFQAGDPPRRNIVWVQPKLLAEVSFANWTHGLHLRAPVFVELRKDKPAPEVTSDSLLLSNPDKVLYPEEGITKLQVAEYYIAMSERLRPYLENRLLAVLRCPEGALGKCFFQKHLNTRADAVAIFEKDAALYVQDVRGLLELVQMGAYEIHARNSRAEAPARPDQFVLDLDPGEGVSWEEVVATALMIKKDLESLGLSSFVKLSGGKGLHVHVPFKSGPSWDEVKRFTHQLALNWERRYPDKYVSKMSKKIRKGKIFIDYLRNSKGSTSVLPYSLRARKTSSVAWPVAWGQLKKYKSGDAISLVKALQLLKTGRDPWGKYFSRVPTLPVKKLRSAS